MYEEMPEYRCRSLTSRNEDRYTCNRTKNMSEISDMLDFNCQTVQYA